jgi:hypothetical protein
MSASDPEADKQRDSPTVRLAQTAVIPGRVANGSMDPLRAFANIRATTSDSRPKVVGGVSRLAAADALPAASPHADQVYPPG